MFKKTAGLIFVFNAIIFSFQALTKSVYPPLLVTFRETFMVDNAGAGLLVTLVFLGYALARFPSGIMADRWGCTKTVLLGSLAMAASFLAITFSSGYLGIALLTFILGVSSGIYVTAGYTFAVIIGTRNRAATATAAFESFGMAATVISPLLVTWFLFNSNWPALFFTLGAALLIITLLMFLKRNSSLALERNYASETGGGTAVESNRGCLGIENQKAQNTAQPLLEIIREPSMRRFLIWSTLVGGLGAISWTGVSSFIPTFLVEDKGYSLDLANGMFAIIAVSGLVSKIWIGWLADRLGTRLMLFLTLMLSVFLVFALAGANEHWQLLLILAMLGISCLNCNTLINSYVLRKVPERCQGTGFGLFSTAYTVIYSAGPFLTGYLSIHLGLSSAIKWSTAGAAAAMFLIVLSNRLPIQPEAPGHQI